jgi:hypothetical protein
VRYWRRDKSACDAADCSTNEQFTMQAGDDSVQDFLALHQIEFSVR